MVCPVCTVGVAVGVGLSRWLGMDDAISGIWAGALILAVALWTVRLIFRKKDKKPLWAYILSVVAWWLITFLPLYWTGFLATCSKMFGVYRLLFGSIVGLIVVLLALKLDQILRKNNEGKARFPYQKVVIPIILLLVASLIMWQGFC